MNVFFQKEYLVDVNMSNVTIEDQETKRDRYKIGSNKDLLISNEII